MRRVARRLLRRPLSVPPHRTPAPQNGARWLQITNRTGWRDADEPEGDGSLTSRTLLTVVTPADQLCVVLGAVAASGRPRFKVTLTINGTTHHVRFRRDAWWRVPASYAGTISDPIDVQVHAGDVIDYRVVSSPGWRVNNAVRWGRCDGEGAVTGDASEGAWPGATVPVFSAPLKLLGRVTGPAEAWLLVGDSITELGFSARAADEAGKAWTCFGAWAESAGDAVGQRSRARARFGRGPAAWTHAICSYGINDLGRSDTDPDGGLAATQAALVDVWTWLEEAGLLVWQTTLSPSSDSTDGWTSIQGQRERHSARPEVNNWIRDGAPIRGVRAGESGHPLSGWIEVADSVESARNSGAWVPGATEDGGHPTEAGIRAMGEAVRERLTS